MPTYEYLCKSCGERFDVVQSFSDKPLKNHSTCGGDLQKVFHARGIVFKGSGFYATDHRSSNSTKTPTKDKAKSKDKTKAETKTEAKAASVASDD